MTRYHVLGDEATLYLPWSILAKKSFLKTIKSLVLTISLLEIKETEGHVNWPLGEAISKIQSVGNY